MTTYNPFADRAEADRQDMLCAIRLEQDEFTTAQTIRALMARALYGPVHRILPERRPMATRRDAA